MEWLPTDRSRSLSGRPSRNTAPELALRKALHACGARFRLHPTLIRGCTPDLVLPSRRVAIFVDGDFWHGCPVHFPNAGGRSGPNAALWQEKRVAVARRDAQATKLAQEQGWTVVRVWECEVRDELSQVVQRILEPEDL